MNITGFRGDGHHTSGRTEGTYQAQGSAAWQASMKDRALASSVTAVGAPSEWHGGDFSQGVDERGVFVASGAHAYCSSDTL